MANATFNPSTYEQPYGFDMLDELHNFLPEILYDNTMFQQTPILAYAQHRLRTLFSPTFARNQHIYNIYAAESRRAMFREWEHQQNLPPQQRDHTNTIPNRVATGPQTPASTWGPLPFASVRMQGGGEAVIPSRTDIDPRTGQVLHTAHAHPRTYAQVATTGAGSSSHGLEELASAVGQRSAGGAAASNPNPIIRVTATMTDSEMSTSSSAPPSASQTPTRVASGNPPAQRRVHPPRNEYISARESIIPAMATIFNEANLEANLLQLLSSPLEFQFVEHIVPSVGVGGGRWVDVDVIPTARQVESGSIIVEGLSVPTDMNCAICQEHQYHGATGPSPWRRLYCTHQFHRECIDSWFTRSVFCPVCRADIRDSSETSQHTPRPASGITNSTLPNQTSGISGTGRAPAPAPVARTGSVSASSVDGTQRLRMAVARAIAEEHAGTDGDHEGQGDDTENDI